MMNKNYQSPTVEIIEIEIEDALLQVSADTETNNSIETLLFGGSYGSFDI